MSLVSRLLKWGYERGKPNVKKVDKHNIQITLEIDFICSKMTLANTVYGVYIESVFKMKYEFIKR